MIQLFETSSVSADCNIGVNDTPFYIPYISSDHIFLRLQPPQYLISANGGGIPIGANVGVNIYDSTGTNVLCNMGAPAAGKYLYDFAVLGNLGEYHFMLPIRINDGSRKTVSFPVALNDEIVVTLGGAYYASWVYGVDATPYPFIDYKSGHCCLRKSAATAIAVTINGTPVATSNVFTDDEVSCFSDTCFRVVVSVTFGATTYQYYTKVMQIIPCEEPSVFLESKYFLDAIDCTGHYHQGFTGSIFQTKHYLRTLADIEKRPSIIKKTYNSKCNQYKSERSEQFQLRSLPMPDWYQDAMETLLIGNTLLIDGVLYMIDNAGNIFENNDVLGSNFQAVNVPLSLCKCQTVFVCS